MAESMHDADCPMTNSDPAARTACVCDGPVAGGSEPIRDTPEGGRTCTTQRHVFGDEPVSLTEGESKDCLCGAMNAALRNGQICVTVRAAVLNERIQVSIGRIEEETGVQVSTTPVRSVLSPGDTVEVDSEFEWTMPGTQPHPPASECPLDDCTYPYPHSHGTDR